MSRVPALLFLLCPLAAGCQSISSEAGDPAWKYATYEDLVESIEADDNKLAWRAEELRHAYLGRPLLEVKKDLERHGFDWSPHRPGSTVVRDFLTHCESTGVAWCERTREIADFPIRDEMLLVQYDKGIVIRLKVCWCNEPGLSREDEVRLQSRFLGQRVSVVKAAMEADGYRCDNHESPFGVSLPGALILTDAGSVNALPTKGLLFCVKQSLDGRTCKVFMEHDKGLVTWLLVD